MCKSQSCITADHKYIDWVSLGVWVDWECCCIVTAKAAMNSRRPKGFDLQLRSDSSPLHPCTHSAGQTLHSSLRINAILQLALHLHWKLYRGVSPKRNLYIHYVQRYNDRAVYSATQLIFQRNAFVTTTINGPLNEQRHDITFPLQHALRRLLLHQQKW